MRERDQLRILIGRRPRQVPGVENRQVQVFPVEDECFVGRMRLGQPAGRLPLRNRSSRPPVPDAFSSRASCPVSWYGSPGRDARHTHRDDRQREGPAVERDRHKPPPGPVGARVGAEERDHLRAVGVGCAVLHGVLRDDGGEVLPPGVPGDRDCVTSSRRCR